MFNNPEIVLYLLPHEIKFYFLREGKIEELKIPETLVNHLEIIDQIGFEKLLEQFIKSIGVANHKCLIILSDKVVFEKNNPEDIQKYLSLIPFSSENIIKKFVYRGKGNVQIYSTNHVIYKTICGVCEKNNLKILGIIPLNAFPDLRGSEDLSEQSINQIVGQKKVIKQNDFIAKEDKKNFYGINSIFFIGLLFIFGATILGYFLFVLSSGKPSTPPAVSFETITTQPTATKLPINKKMYAITVLNGSGKPGEAGKLKNTLEGKGYLVEEVGNADKEDYEKTLIKAEKNIDSVYLNDLKKVLSSSYSINDKIEFIENQKAPIIIILGKF